MKQTVHSLKCKDARKRQHLLRLAFCLPADNKMPEQRVSYQSAFAAFTVELSVVRIKNFNAQQNENVFTLRRTILAQRVRYAFESRAPAG